MNGGIEGTFVIAWSQIFVDGMSGLQPEDLEKGARWMWKGEPVRIDGPQELLLLGDAMGQAVIRKRAAKVVKKLVGATLENKPLDRVEMDQSLTDTVVILTDGQSTFTMTLIDLPNGPPLAMFADGLPPQGAELWVVEKDIPNI
ncbi:MAG: hemolysin-type calcium-binding protein, partial [Planktomarina sp.]